MPSHSKSPLLLLRSVATETFGEAPFRLGALGVRDVDAFGSDGSDLILPVSFCDP